MRSVGIVFKLTFHGIETALLDEGLSRHLGYVVSRLLNKETKVVERNPSLV